MSSTEARASPAWTARWCSYPACFPAKSSKSGFGRRRKNYAEATLLEVVQPSPKRVAPVCPLAGTCPGCCYQHADYGEEIRLKQAQFMNLLERQAKVAGSICLPPVPSPKPMEYRNKISLHASPAAPRRLWATWARTTRR